MSQKTAPISSGYLAGYTNQSANAVAIGNNAGQVSQGTGSVAIGYQAGQHSQGVNSMAIGYQAGVTGQGNASFAMGFQAGLVSQGNNALAIGYVAGQTGQGAMAEAIGYGAGQFGQGTGAIALGYMAGNTGQGAFAEAIGYQAGASNQGANAFAVGYQAGASSQGANALALGYMAGVTGQSANATAAGYMAGAYGQNANTVAFGYMAGATGQGTGAFAMGFQAGNWNQGQNAIAMGFQAGMTGQGQNAVAVGYQAGVTGQNANAVAVGYQAGEFFQGAGAVAIGTNAGMTGQGANALAVGANAGSLSQGDGAIAFGASAGQFSQGQYAMALGYQAGMTGQKANAVAVGYQAGQSAQGDNAFAMGYMAGNTGQGQNALAIGYQAGMTGQGFGAFAMGFQSGQFGQGVNAMAVGYGAGMTGQKSGALAVGYGAGMITQGTNAMAVGYGAGMYNQSDNGFAVGFQAGVTGQGSNALAMGNGAGASLQGVGAIAVGFQAGMTGQGTNAVAIGYQAGMTGQGSGTVAIGYQAGATGQGQNSSAIGYQAGQFFQGQNSIAMGFQAGMTGQQSYSVAIGFQAGMTGQQSYSAAIGNQAGMYTQGTGAFALGYQAGQTNQGQGAIALGTNSGNTNQGQDSFAAGVESGYINQGMNAMAIGWRAGRSYQGTGAFAAGYQAGFTGQNANAAAVGYQAGMYTQGTGAFALGYQAGMTGQGFNAVALGYQAGQSTQGNFAVAVGNLAGVTGQNTNAVAIGNMAGQYGQGAGSVAIGYQAGVTGQKANTVAIGNSAGQFNQGANALAVGFQAGMTGQNDNAMALGNSAGQFGQGTGAFALGFQAGMTGQGANAVAMGFQAGVSLQGAGAFAAGYQAGMTGQNATALAIGFQAGASSQGTGAFAIGFQAGMTGQRANAGAIGHGAGQYGQGTGAFAIGYQAGQSAQGAGAVAIGYQAGYTGQGANSIAIGNSAGVTGITANSIVLNASGVGFFATGPTGAFYVSPVSTVADSGMTKGHILVYGENNQIMKTPATIDKDGAFYYTATPATSQGGTYSVSNFSVTDGKIGSSLSSIAIGNNAGSIITNGSNGSFTSGWTGTVGSGDYIGCAMSSNGYYQVYGTSSGLKISNNSANTWEKNIPMSIDLNSIYAISGDGLSIVVCNKANTTVTLYKTTSLSSWTQYTTTSITRNVGNTLAVDISKTGQYILLVTTSNVYATDTTETILTFKAISCAADRTITKGSCSFTQTGLATFVINDNTYSLDLTTVTYLSNMVIAMDFETTITETTTDLGILSVSKSNVQNVTNILPSLSTDYSKTGTRSLNFLHDNGTKSIVAGISLNSTLFTLCAWVYPRVSGSWGLLFEIADSSNCRNDTNKPSKFSIAINEYARTLQIVETSTTNVTTTRAVSPDAWTHIALVFSNNTIKSYINGSLDSSLPYTLNTTLDKLCIGTRYFTNIILASDSYPFNGYMDDLRIYNKALNDTDIYNLYALFTHPNMYLSFENGFDAIIKDSITASATASISGGSVVSISVTNGGFGYINPIVTISGGGGSGARATASISGGVVNSITVTNGGTNYTSVPTVFFTNPSSLSPANNIFMHISNLDKRYGTMSLRGNDNDNDNFLAYNYPLVKTTDILSVTACAWFRVNNFSSRQAIFSLSGGYNDTVGGYDNGWNSGSVMAVSVNTSSQVMANFYGGPSLTITSGSINTGWNHVAVTFTQNGLFKLYVNGSLVSTQTNSQPRNTNGWQGNFIGGKNQVVYLRRYPFSGDKQPLFGYIDDFRIYDHELPPNFISALYNSSYFNKAVPLFYPITFPNSVFNNVITSIPSTVNYTTLPPIGLQKVIYTAMSRNGRFQVLVPDANANIYYYSNDYGLTFSEKEIVLSPTNPAITNKKGRGVYVNNNGRILICKTTNLILSGADSNTFNTIAPIGDEHTVVSVKATNSFDTIIYGGTKPVSSSGFTFWYKTGSANMTADSTISFAQIPTAFPVAYINNRRGITLSSDGNKAVIQYATTASGIISIILELLYNIRTTLAKSTISLPEACKMANTIEMHPDGSYLLIGGGTYGNGFGRPEPIPSISTQIYKATIGADNTVSTFNLLPSSPHALWDQFVINGINIYAIDFYANAYYSPDDGVTWNKFTLPVYLNDGDEPIFSVSEDNKYIFYTKSTTDTLYPCLKLNSNSTINTFTSTTSNIVPYTSNNSIKDIYNENISYISSSFNASSLVINTNIQTYYTNNTGQTWISLQTGNSTGLPTLLSVNGVEMSSDGSYLILSSLSGLYTLNSNYNTNQQTNSLAIGNMAGSIGQAANAIAIGALAGQTNQPANTIVLNASGSVLNADVTNGCFIAPIADYRNSTSKTFSMLGYGTDNQIVQIGTYLTPTLTNYLSGGISIVASTQMTQLAKTPVIMQSLQRSGAPFSVSPLYGINSVTAGFALGVEDNNTASNTTGRLDIMLSGFSGVDNNLGATVDTRVATFGIQGKNMLYDSTNFFTAKPYLQIPGHIMLPADGGSSIIFVDSPTIGNQVTAATTYGRMFAVGGSVYQDFVTSFQWRKGTLTGGGTTTAMELNATNGLKLSQGCLRVTSNSGNTSGNSLDITQTGSILYFGTNMSVPVSISTTSAYGAISIYAKGDIITGAAIGTFSDARIKKDITDASGSIDIINKIPLHQYNYIDPERGTHTAYGVIAQEVKAVFPEAIKLITEYIPNIFCIASAIVLVDDVTVQITVPSEHGLVVGDKVKIILEKGARNECKVVSIVDANTVAVEKWDKYDAFEKVFLYGKEVNDFHSVDKSRLATLALGGIQDLYKMIKDLQAQVVSLQAQIASTSSSPTGSTGPSGSV